MRAAPENVQAAAAAQARGDHASVVRLLEPLVASGQANARVLNALAASHLQLGHRKKGVAVLRRALEIDSEQHHARLNLMGALLEAGGVRAALEVARDGPASFLRLPQASMLRGAAHNMLEQFERAHQVLAGVEQPDPATLYQLGVALEGVGAWNQARAAFEQVVNSRSQFAAALSDLMFLNRRLCHWSDGADHLRRAREILQRGQTGLKPFAFLSEPVTAKEQQRCARLWSTRFEQSSPAPDWTHKEDKPLTVGYVSSGFRAHPTACLSSEFFEYHGASNSFHTIAYSTGPDDGSTWRRRLEKTFNRFRDVSGDSHDSIARQVRNDGVDILVDMRGYGGGAVTEVFALRPAPIQVNYLAYPGTTAAPWMDYIVVDTTIASDAVRAGLSEAALVMPFSYQPTDTTRTVPSPPSRTECGLPDTGTVFCSFNNSYKIGPEVFACWMQILTAVDQSVLWLLAPVQGATRDNLWQAARQAGIDPDRVIFMNKQPHFDYLGRLALADLFLDTWPYNAHTTASDALWAGCPVLTWPGQTFASRVGASLVTSAGMAELVVASQDDYVERAIQLGRDPSTLQTLKQKLGAAKGQAKLFQTAAYARTFEEGLEQMARQAAAGNKPQDIVLSDSHYQ